MCPRRQLRVGVLLHKEKPALPHERVTYTHKTTEEASFIHVCVVLKPADLRLPAAANFRGRG